MKLFKNLFQIILLLFSIIQISQADESIVGIWQTIDDNTKQVRSLVELSIEDNKLYGKIIKLFPQDGDPQNPICEKCKNERRNKAIMGLQIIDGLSKKRDEWIDGEILDPDNGKTYDCKIWLDKGELKVRGYIGFFYRTQKWIRYTFTD
ncbi:MAG: hypothetical protein COB38_04960 [Gammaproteobacteria bacterium]|nr:MAG: hypothetical protein COB38_04960 [Gammaproteobacteria bacterium]